MKLITFLFILCSASCNQELPQKEEHSPEDFRDINQKRELESTKDYELERSVLGEDEFDLNP
jgi:hypothetical protein